MHRVLVALFYDLWHCFRSPLDADILEEFPDVRAKVAKKLEWVGNEQVAFLRLIT